jgi:hypothetical protein
MARLTNPSPSTSWPKPGRRASCNRTGWWKSPKPNHYFDYFDATYQAIIARSMRGIGVLETPLLPTMPAVQPTGPEQPVTPSVAMFERNRW